MKSDYIFWTTSPAGDLTISVLCTSFIFHSTILFRDSVTRDTSRMIIIYWEVPHSQFRFKFARCSANIYEWHCLMYRLCIITQQIRQHTSLLAKIGKNKDSSFTIVSHWHKHWACSIRLSGKWKIIMLENIQWQQRVVSKSHGENNVR